MFISNRAFGLMSSAFALVFLLFGCADKNNPSNGGAGGEAAYTLTVASKPVGGGDVSLSPDKARYDAGERVTAAASPKKGYEFTGWSGAVALPSSSVTVTMDGDKALTANFSERRYALATAVSPEDCGSVALTPDRARYDVDTKVKAEAVPKSGCKFEGWSGASTAKDGEVTITVSEDKSLTAHFSRLEYKLTANVSQSGGGNVLSAPTGSSHRAGTTVYLTAVAASGYEFIGWSGSLKSENSVDSVIMDGDRAVTANFIRTYTLTTGVSAVDGEGIGGRVLRSPDQTSYREGTTVTVTAIPDKKHWLLQWLVSWRGAAPADSVFTVTMDEDKEVTAYFGQVFKLTTKALPADGGQVLRKPDQEDYFYRGARHLIYVYVTAVANEGYRFTGWSGALTSKYTTDTLAIHSMKSDLTVTANFERVIKTDLGKVQFSSPDTEEGALDVVKTGMKKNKK